MLLTVQRSSNAVHVSYQKRYIRIGDLTPRVGALYCLELDICIWKVVARKIGPARRPERGRKDIFFIEAEFFGDVVLPSEVDGRYDVIVREYPRHLCCRLLRKGMNDDVQV